MASIKIDDLPNLNIDVIDLHYVSECLIINLDCGEQKSIIGGLKWCPFPPSDPRVPL
jgi:hypothetical protein